MVEGLVDELVAEPARLRAVAKAAGQCFSDGEIHVERLPGVVTNMTTQELARVRMGSAAGAVSCVVKVAQSPRRSPLWDRIPPEMHEEAMFNLPWRAEAAIYQSPLPHLLPPGLRAPVIYSVEELDDERLAIWMEDVSERPTPWTRDQYRAAAVGLGRLAGRFPKAQVPPDVPVDERDLRSYFFGRIAFGILPTLFDDGTWRHPSLAAIHDPSLRDDLRRLADVAPQILDRLDALPRTLAHGDACPQNLLRPIDDAAALVAIDWTFAGVCPIGMDAGQLLAGRAESGELDPHDLAELYAVIVEGYTAGVRAEGMVVSDEDVRFGIAGNLVIRSAFSALPVESIDEWGTPECAGLIASRAAYARFLVDLGLRNSA